MQPKKPLPRRVFLLALTALGFSLGLPFRKAAARELVFRSLCKFMQREHAGARYLGTSYLSEPGHRQLTMQTLDEFQRLGLCQPKEIAAHIQARRRSDFSRGAIFVQDGWVFADIEARICAIVALA
jgi:hypothetical protein